MPTAPPFTCAPDAVSDPNVTRSQEPRALSWLDRNWLPAGVVVAAFLVALLPILVGVWSRPLVLVYLLLLVYLLHQVEEHRGDRFRRFVNARVAGGADALTPRAVMVINVGLVWAVYVAVLLGAGLLDVGVGLIAVYITLANAAGHVGAALVQRTYNPGLWTALALFVPVGVWAWAVVSAANGLGAAAHVVGVAVALATHAGIVAAVRRRARRLSAAPGARAAT